MTYPAAGLIFSIWFNIREKIGLIYRAKIVRQWSKIFLYNILYAPGERHRGLLCPSTSLHPVLSTPSSVSSPLPPPCPPRPLPLLTHLPDRKMRHKGKRGAAGEKRAKKQIAIKLYRVYSNRTDTTPG